MSKLNQNSQEAAGDRPDADGSPPIMDYDPNLTYSGKMADQTVRLVFGQWKYRAEMTVVVGGNCRGLDVIKTAVSSAHEKLEYTTYRGNDYAKIMLTDSEGNSLECEDEEFDCEDWLGEMLLSAEIIKIAPEQDEENKEHSDR